MVKLQSTLPSRRPRPPSLPAARSSTRQYKGVRMRSWVRWVSEIRIPRSRDKIWLGSYSTPEKAARAFDAAVLLLRGASSTLNFPDSAPNFASPSCQASPRTIQAAVSAVANVNDDLLQVPQTDDLGGPYTRSLHEMAEVSPPALFGERLSPEAEPSASLTGSECLTSSDESSLSYNKINLTLDTTESLSPQNFHSIPCSIHGPMHEHDTFEDLFSFGTLSHYGFTAISCAVTISERFDIDLDQSTDSSLWNM